MPPISASLVAVQAGAPLSLRAVRRSLERLFSTGRFSDVVARSEEVAGGVVVVFELVPVVRIARVEVSGVRSLPSDEVLAAARLAEGSEYWPARLDDARAGLLAFYARRGWNAAEVQATAVPQGKDVVVPWLVVEGAADAGGGGALRGPAGLPESRLALGLRLKVHDILDRTRLEPGAEAVRVALPGDPSRARTGRGAAGAARATGRRWSPFRSMPARPSPSASPATAATRTAGSGAC